MIAIVPDNLLRRRASVLFIVSFHFLFPSLSFLFFRVLSFAFMTVYEKEKGMRGLIALSTSRNTVVAGLHHKTY